MEEPLTADSRPPLGAELGEVLDRLAHELKTPLVSIKGYAELLLDQTRQPLEPDLREWVRRIASAANRLNDLVRKAMAEARAEATWSYNPVSVAPAEWLRRATEEAAALAAGRSLRWNWEADEGLPAVALDPDAGRDLLLELLGNAARNTPDGGAVRVRAATEVRGGRPGVRVTVSDTGVGLPPGPEGGRAFEKFVVLGDVMAHTSGPFDFGAAGLGLGLSMVRGVARAHGGDAWAEGLGRDPAALPGAHVHLWLPATPAVPEAAARDLPRGRLLVIDAHPEACVILAASLAEAYDVEVAGTGRAGLALWRAPGARWDACVFDPALPDLTGVELVRALRAAPSGTAAALVCYATAGHASGSEALRAAGADTCLAKPVRARVLLQRLATLRARSASR